MKILNLTSVYRKGWGVGLVVSRTAENLRTLGHNVLVATSDMDDSIFDGEAVTVIDGSYNSTLKVVESHRPDVVIVHTPPFFEFIAAMEDTNFIKVAYDYGEPFPFLFEGKERSYRESLDWHKYHSWFPAYNIHISISEFVKRCSGFENSHVVYCGADHIKASSSESICDMEKHIKGKLVSSLFRIGKGESHYKGVDILKEVKRRIAIMDGDLEFTFIVMGRMAEGGAEIRLDLENEGFVVLTDVSDGIRHAILKRSDVYLSTSLWEGFDLPLVEAQYLGTAGTALSTGAHPEVCPYHYPTLDELVYHLYRVLSDNSYRIWCSKTCRSYVTGKFDWKKNGEKLAAILTSACLEKKEKGLATLGMPGDIIMDSASRNAEIVSNHLKRIGCEAVAKAVSGRITIDYMLDETPEVSIIIPNKDHCTDLRSCISSIIDKSTYKNYRILIIDNASSERDILNYYDTLQKNYSNIEVYFYQKRFNFSEIINFGVSKSKSEYLVFLNNDTEVITPGWLEMMVGICRRNDIGAVGVKLYYPDGRIQHAGIVLGAGGIAANAYRCFEGNAEGYMNNLMTIRNVSAVTAACMMTKKTLFNSVGGFEEKLAVAFNDVDYCLKLRKKGYLIVWTPFVELYHHESKTREPDGVCGHKNRFAREIDFMRNKWGPVLCNDPYHNKHIPIDRLVHL